MDINIHCVSPMPERHPILALKAGARCSYVAPPVHTAQPLKIQPLPVRSTATHQSSLTAPLYVQVCYQKRSKVTLIQLSDILSDTLAGCAGKKLFEDTVLGRVLCMFHKPSIHINPIQFLWVSAAPLWPRFNCELNLTAATGRAGRFIGTVPQTFGNYNVILLYQKGSLDTPEVKCLSSPFYPPNGVFGRFFFYLYLVTSKSGCTMCKAALKMKPNQNVCCSQKTGPRFFGRHRRLQIWGPNSLGLWTHMLHCTNFCCLELALALCHDNSVSLCLTFRIEVRKVLAYTHPHTHIYYIYIYIIICTSGSSKFDTLF